MSKSFTKKEVFALMKITFTQLILVGVLTSHTVAYPVVAQELLKERVNLTLKNSSLRLFLRSLEKQVDVVFSYQKGVIQSDEKLNLTIQNETVDNVLKQVLSPRRIYYRVINNNQIILSREAKNDQAKQESNMSSPSVELLEIKKIDRVITGHVTDEKGESLPGVSVVVKNTSRGTTTDTDGSFRLTISEENPSALTLVFSFVGYLNQEIAVGNRSTVEVHMAPDQKSLDEVVVVGYGEQSRKDLTTAIAKVSGKDINQLPVSTPGEALAGLAAGVQVQSGRGGTPGEPPIIRIRGTGSLGAGNDPLYVVDGYPLQNASQFSRMNAADIESIEILKDAASAAIYGSRAANGVVIVTTKRGKAGKTRFEVNAYTGIQQVAKKIDVMNKEQYLTLSKQAAAVRNEKYPDIFDHPDELPDTDWQDIIFRTAPMSEVQLTASGGTEKIRFSSSGSYLTQQGTLIGTDYKLATFRVNVDAELSAKLKIGVNFAPSYQKSNVRNAGGQYNSSSNVDFGAALPSPIYTALLMPPIIPVHYANGDYGQPNASPTTTQYGYLNGLVNLYNPLAVLELVKNTRDNFRLLNNAFLEWAPLPGLKFRTQGGISLEMNSTQIYIPPTLSYDSAPTASLSHPTLNGIVSSVSNNRTVDWLWENTLTYTKQWGADHHLSALLLYSLQEYNALNSSINGKVGTYTTDLVQNPTASPDRNGTVGYGLNSFLSYAARLNYDFKDRYLFSAAVRRDASSRFGPNQRFGTFPSISVGWRLGNEPFIKNLALLSELKLRASYGETGNANIGDFSWVSGVGSTNYSFGGQRVFGTQQSGYANPDLTWEKNRQTDLGLEVGFLKDRIYLTLDFYEKITQGMLFAKQLPGIVGYASTFQTNVGKLRNRGFELALTTHNTTGPLRWTTDVNVALNRSMVLDLGGQKSLSPSSGIDGWPNVYRIEVGQPIGNMYGFILDGVFKNQSELDAGPKWTGGSQIGDYKGRDMNGDNKIDENDRTLLGNGLPKFTYGMTNRLNYKNVDLTVIVQGVQGNSIINGNARHGEAPFGKFNARSSVYNNFFLASDPNRDVKYNRSNATGLVLSGQLTSYAVYDGSFLRVRNVTLGYTLPSSVLKKIRLQSARFYISGQNLLTFTKYPGFNPEPSLYDDSVYQPGSDQGTYPANRIFTTGLNIGF